MILWALGSLVISGLFYFIAGFFTRSIVLRASIGVLPFLILTGIGFCLMSHVDDPPPGSRIITQQELERSAGIENEQDGQESEKQSSDDTGR